MRRRRAQRGQVMVEVAVVFPLLVMIALGLVQFAIYYHVHNVIQAGVQEAARTAAAIDGTRDKGEARGEALIAASYRTPQHIEIEMSVVGDDNDIVQAEVSTSYPTFFPAFSWTRGITHLDLPINATARVRQERFRGR
jgi:hypothetical protein